MRHLCSIFVILFVFWILLSQHFSLFFIILGLASCGITLWVCNRIYPKPQTDQLWTVLGRVSCYMFWITKEIGSSSLAVSRIIWQAQPKISQNVSWISTDFEDDLNLTLYANSITLTPGTVSLVVHPGMIQVHSLHSTYTDELQEGGMEQRIKKITAKQGDMA